MTTARHPDEHTTAAYLEGRLAPAARDGVEAHLAACDTCRSGVALLRLGEKESDEAVPPEMVRRARGPAAAAGRPEAGDAAPVAEARRGRRFVLPVAAGLVATLGLAIWLGSRGPALAPGGAGPDGPAEAPIERGDGVPALEAISPARGDVVPAGSLTFRWKAVEGADRYVVTLLDAGGAGIAAIETGPAGPLAKNESWLDWPADRPLPAAGTYLWSVRALALDRVLAETHAVPFEIR
jgi:hypothetical protein